MLRAYTPLGPAPAGGRQALQRYGSLWVGKAVHNGVHAGWPPVRLGHRTGAPLECSFPYSTLREEACYAESVLS